MQSKLPSEIHPISKLITHKHQTVIVNHSMAIRPLSQAPQKKLIESALVDRLVLVYSIGNDRKGVM